MDQEPDFIEVRHDFLERRAEKYGLAAKYVFELPDEAQESLWRLDQLGNRANGEWIGMLDESLASAAFLQKNLGLIQKIFGCDELAARKIVDNGIKGSLISDLGKVASPELTWLYREISFDVKTANEHKQAFLTAHSLDPNMEVMDMPYKWAMEFYRELYTDDPKKIGQNWDDQKKSCDTYLSEIGIDVSEDSFHDVMTGAHLRVLPGLLQKWGIDHDQDGGFIGMNHHLSRAVIDGVPAHDGQFLHIILAKLPQSEREQWIKAALVEEYIDMAVATYVRTPRPGDNFGVMSERRIMNNLRKSLGSYRLGENRLAPSEYKEIKRILKEIVNDGEFGSQLLDYLQVTFPKKSQAAQALNQ